MKLCPTCGQSISHFGRKIVKCSLCSSEFCTGCESEFRKEPRNLHGFPLCKKCDRELESDEVLGLEVTCPNCSKEYFLKEYHEIKCRCGLYLHTVSGKVTKTMVLSCPTCDHEVDPFDERLLSCAMCGDLFCSHCEKGFRETARGEGLFPLCEKCYGSLGSHETVMVLVHCENCDDTFTFFDPSKIACLHGQVVRLRDPFPVRCKCGKFHTIKESDPKRVRLYVDHNQQVKFFEVRENDYLEESNEEGGSGDGEQLLIEDEEEDAVQEAESERLLEGGGEVLEELLKEEGGEELPKDYSEK